MSLVIIQPVFRIRRPRDVLVQAAHEPAQVGEPMSPARDAGRAGVEAAPPFNDVAVGPEVLEVPGEVLKGGSSGRSSGEKFWDIHFCGTPIFDR